MCAGVARASPKRCRSPTPASTRRWPFHGAPLARPRCGPRRDAPGRVPPGRLLFFEPAFADAMWLVADYFPEIRSSRANGARRARPLARHARRRGGRAGSGPADCVDGFAGCFWNRPEAYLDPDVQAGISCFAKLAPAVRERGTRAAARPSSRRASGTRGTATCARWPRRSSATG